MPHADFVHLRVHSSYSLSEGAIKPEKIVALAREGAMPAVAITDTGNLFGALEFSQACAAKGVQPIIGCQIALSREDNPRLPPDPVVLLAQNSEGFANLRRLSTTGFLETDPGLKPQLPLGRVLELSAGLILLTGGSHGPLARLLAEGQQPEAERLLARLAEAFGDRAVMELHRHGLPAQAAIEPGLIALADGAGLPLVATNDCLFANPAMYEAHDALLCIAEGRLLGMAGRIVAAWLDCVRVLSGWPAPEHRVRVSGAQAGAGPGKCRSTAAIVRPGFARGLVARLRAVLGLRPQLASGRWRLRCRLGWPLPFGGRRYFRGRRASADAGASGGGCASAYAGSQGDAGPSGGGCVSGDAGGPARVCHSADDRAAAAARRPVLRLRRAAGSPRCAAGHCARPGGCRRGHGLVRAGRVPAAAGGSAADGAGCCRPTAMTDARRAAARAGNAGRPAIRPSAVRSPLRGGGPPQ